MTNVEEVERRENELATLRNDTKSQLLTEGRQIIEALSEIGFEFELIEKNGTARNNVSSRTCSQCHIAGHTKARCPELSSGTGAASASTS